MAKRRMFAKSVVCSARFLRLSEAQRLLYYDLGMNTDDDGVVEAFTVLRLTNASEDDLRILAENDFIVMLNENLVIYITDWRVNNQLRKTRYNRGIYFDLLVEKGLVEPDKMPDEESDEDP